MGDDVPEVLIVIKYGTVVHVETTKPKLMYRVIDLDAKRVEDYEADEVNANPSEWIFENFEGRKYDILEL